MESKVIESKYASEAFAITHIGGRKENQDSCFYGESPLGTVFTVCDGMGGMVGGKKASTIAVTTIVSVFMNASEEDDPKTLIETAIKQANDDILAFAASNPDYTGMGTTATVVLINDKSAILAHVGDSRIYQLRRGRKIFRTMDHSMVFELVKRKVLTEEQARLSEQSNVIMRALGVRQTSELEVDITERSFKKGDRFILCTDGFWGTMPEEKFLNLVNIKGPLDIVFGNAAKAIDELCIAQGGGHDNLTAITFEPNISSSFKESSKFPWKPVIYCVLSLAVLSGAVAAGLRYQEQIKDVWKKLVVHKDAEEFVDDSLVIREPNIDSPKDTGALETPSLPTDEVETDNTSEGQLDNQNN